MKKVIVTALVMGLVAGSLAVPAAAQKKKKKPKAVATVLFLDGESTYGEEDQRVNGNFLKLSKEAGKGAKSHGIPNYTGGPNTKCAGNSLMPVFVGGVSGAVKGDMKVTFEAMATPAAKVEVRVWPDMNAQACNDAYPEPAGSAIVDLPTSRGEVEAVIEGLDFSAVSLMMIQITPVIGPPPSYGRAYYGTENTKVQFLCTPASGSSCI